LARDELSMLKVELMVELSMRKDELLLEISIW
ncbi:hypothetical protein A2U01_0095124, partial [Trifolium medium]|nr:hypothetical protein [Trifolium medium]